MKKFTKIEIEETKKHFRSKGYEEVRVELGNRDFSYFILPQSINPNLQNFAFRMSGDPKDGVLIGVSDKVKEGFRKYVAIHEYIEFAEIRYDERNRCVLALDRELNLVPESIKPEYLKMRRDFFEALVKYCKIYPQLYTDDDIDEMEISKRNLEEICKEREI